MIAEKLLNKLQDQLGSNYKLMLDNAFAEEYTNKQSDSVNWQAFEKDKDLIIGVLSLTNATYAVVPFISFATTYTLQFWLPVNVLKLDSNGELLETPKFNIFDDLEAMRIALNNKTNDFGEYRGQITFSEPKKGTVLDIQSGTEKVVVTVTGSFDITDNGIYGRDTTIKIGITEDEEVAYYAINGVTNLILNGNVDGTSGQEQGETVPMQDGQLITNDISFNVDDAEGIANNFIIDKAYGVDVSITPVPIQIYRNGFETFTDDGTEDEFTLKTTKEITINAVTINGVATTAYTLTTKTIKFTVAPVKDAVIKINYNKLMTEYNALMSATVSYANGESGIGNVKVSLARIKE